MEKLKPYRVKLANGLETVLRLTESEAGRYPERVALKVGPTPVTKGGPAPADSAPAAPADSKK